MGRRGGGRVGGEGEERRLRRCSCRGKEGLERDFRCRVAGCWRRAGPLLRLWIIWEFGGRGSCFWQGRGAVHCTSSAAA